ncbi:hypothetical protein DQ244_05905 [Blastococcus sp. TBT05-19]|uniref:hypothetical protein n=1 Tax=Blastococcus sp. TBT05-19 TaxID=2250581 RepID=UPI000DE9BEBF|nr:hypothetical protein [Blastococcus sp. TBT05-19]RBY94798.1 hypothetical protein DQ244_05905 [Blastococcus sp. TBT05-19]
MDEASEDRLWAALRDGRRDDVVEVLLAMAPRDRKRLRPAVHRHEDLVMAEPIGARSPDGSWLGELRPWHQSAAIAALLGCSTVEQAVRYAPLDPPDSVDLPKAFFPDRLDAFVREWSARYLRNPKAWDRIRGLEAMFDWAAEGLIPPPTEDGAVLLLITAVPKAYDGHDLLRYLEARPVLIDVTLRRIFDVDGIKGASLAQRDQMWQPGHRMDDVVIPELIRRGHWTVEFVEDGIARALARGQTPYLERWFRGLAVNVAPLRDRAAPPGP